ncbi:MAG: mercuric ion transporter MerT [Burkholderiaceae bacterium]|jgi:mercuric ion transport protein|nr:mercuric ion transporter MerT [Burkholderiaceae bacterium]
MKPDSPTDSRGGGGRGALLTGGLAAILASTCCLGPLVLITLGISGAWISNLTLLEPYRPVFISAAVVALFFAYRRIWRPVAACAPGQVCALPPINRSYKALFWIVVALVIIALGFPLIAPWFY